MQVFMVFTQRTYTMRTATLQRARPPANTNAHGHAQVQQQVDKVVMPTVVASLA